MKPSYESVAESYGAKNVEAPRNSGRATTSKQALQNLNGYEAQRQALAMQPSSTPNATTQPQLTDSQIQSAITYNLESHAVSMLIRVRTLLQEEGLLAGSAPEGGYVDVAPTDICTAAFCRAVAAYQQANDLTGPDGKLGPTTFGLFEALGMEYGVAGGSNAAGRTIVPKNAPADQQYDYFRSVILENNGVFFDRQGYINIIGIRGGQLGEGNQITHGDNAFNRWNDTLVVLKIDAEGVKHVDVYEGTTDPGVTRSGVATLPEGTYSYKVGTHKDYTAMNPSYSSVTPAVRNGEAYLGREGRLGSGGAAGINIHTTHGWNHGKLQGPGAYSEGCAVVNGEDRYQQFIEHMTTSNKSAASGGAGQSVYYYTVLSAAHFGTMEVQSQEPTSGPE
jgi:hypothetical protein